MGADFSGVRRDSSALCRGRGPEVLFSGSAPRRIPDGISEVRRQNGVRGGSLLTPFHGTSQKSSGEGRPGVTWLPPTPILSLPWTGPRDTDRERGRTIGVSSDLSVGVCVGTGVCFSAETSLWTETRSRHRIGSIHWNPSMDMVENEVRGVEILPPPPQVSLRG